MATLEQAQVNDIGTIITLTVYDGSEVVDISSATSMQIRLKPKNGLRIDKTATFVTDGVDGKIECVVSTNDFAVGAVYSVQGYIVMPSGTWHTSIKEITVNKNL
jgi:hypothetical protein